MAPTTILNKLAQVRRRERLLRFVWGGARVLAVALGLLAVCCLTDWLIDRWVETPRWLLALSLAGQVFVAAVLTLLLVLLPTFRPLSDSRVALWIERTFPAFHHRLVTAVELNRAHAAIEGMSPILIAEVTREAEQKAAAINFSQAIDSRRLLWSVVVLAPVLLIVLVPVLFASRTVGELLSRQLLLPVDITRSVHFELQNVTTLPPEGQVVEDEKRPPHTDIHTPAICASGDALAVRFKATGPVNKDTRGVLRLRPEGGAAEYHELVWESTADDGQQVFVAKIPPSSVNFTYRAWLGDARLHQPGEVNFEPRPTVDEQQVAILLPTYCGLRSDGTRYCDVSRRDTKGEVVGMSGSTAVVKIKASKPLKKAMLELLGPSQPGAPEQKLSERDLDLDETGMTALGQFDLDPKQTAYRIIVWDTYGFASHVIPRRGIALLPDEPPQVSLLPERFVPEAYRYTARPDEYDREGIPVILGDTIRIAYRAKSAAGLSRAQLRYRINEDKEFKMLEFQEYKASPEVGAFELERGIFAKIREDDRTNVVPFYPMDVKESERDVLPPRREGGGRYHFQTAGLEDSHGNKLKVGDKIEFYVEVFDNRPEHLVGRSEARIKDVVTQQQMVAWELARRQETTRLLDLKNRQSGLFDPPSDTPMP